MDIPLNAEVTCSDGTSGFSICLVINPVQKEVTHVVIETKGLLGMEYMVPIDRILSSTPHQIRLRCTREELAELKPFIRSEFIGPEDSQYRYYLPTALEREAEGGFFWPYTTHEDYGMYIGMEQFPHDELGIHRGAQVEATDGRIGRVDEFIINPDNNHITHLVLREGHLWGQKDVTIPVSDIGRIEEDTVYLKLDKRTVKEMPGIHLH